ncbi:MAG TPA: PDZ domain-containing protein [Terriglobales bacterium]|nr:PDZ domain-containing protein [Terriglobales bacterium]
MRKTSIITVLALNAALAFSQSAPPAPPAPETPQTPETPQVAPVPKTPRTPRTPRPPRPPRSARVLEDNASYLGIEPRDVTPERQSALKLNSDKGVEVMMVDADAPAGKAGLKEHDVILSYNGKQIDDVNQLRSLIRETKPGTKVNLGISRDGKQMNMTAEMTARKNSWDTGVIHIPKIEIPPMPEIDVPSFAMLQYSRRNGLMVENLTRQLGDFFGAKEGKGVLVRSVEKNSPAEAAGFKAGDVIIRVGTEPVENMSDWNQLIRSQQAGKIPVTVIRERHESTFTLTMPERRGQSQTGAAEGFDGDDDIVIADLGPQFRQQMQDLQKQFNSPEFRKQIDQWKKEFKDSAVNRKELQREIQRAHREMERAMREMQKQNWNIDIHTDDNDKE